MSDTFQVAAHRDALAEDEQGVPYLVVVFESGTPGLVGHLRVLHSEEEGVHLLRIVWAQLESEDEDAAVHLTLENGAWWHRALDAVLEHLIGKVATDELAEGPIRFGWVGGEVRFAGLRPFDGGEPGSAVFRWAVHMAREWSAAGGSPVDARRVFDPDSDLTEEQLEAFFEDIALLLAAKAFEVPEGDGDEGAAGDAAPEGGDR